MLWRGVVSLTGSNAAIVVTPPTWRLRAGRFLVALVALAFAYQAYALLVVPWVEPPPPPELQSSGDLPAREPADPELAALFPEGAWERENPMVLRTQAGRLLFQDFERSEDGRIELHPCTIVFYAPAGQQGGAKSQRPVILQTPDKAVLSFSESPDIVSGRIGKLQGALLEGDVRIFSAETQPGANDALLITTRNIQILPQQIWTPHDVVFQYGSSRGSGRDLSITLAAERDDDAGAARQALVQSIEMLELVHIDKLLLDLPGKGLLADLSPASAAGASTTQLAPLSPPASTAVEVTCQGPFQFDFQRGVAQLEDHVDVVRMNPEGPSDQLNCQTLRIHFQTPDASSGPPAAVATNGAAPATAGGPATGLPKLVIRSIEAVGLPVTLRAPSVQAAARGQVLQYDFVTRRILLQDERQASFVFRQHETVAIKLEYALAEDPQRLGRLTAVGPGVFRGVFGKLADQHLEASWNGSLELYPQGDLHVLSAAEGATIRWNEMGRFSADKLYVWLAEVSGSASAKPPLIKPVSIITDSTHIELVGPTVAGADPAAATTVGPAIASDAAGARPPAAGDPATTSSPPPQTRVEVRPIKMLAEGNVQADSPQFRGNTPRLEIWFDHPTETSQELAPPPPAVDDAAAPPDPAANKPSPIGQAKRMELSGNYVRLRLLMIQPRPTVSEATVLGQVRLAQVSLLPAETVPLLVSGEMLQLRTDALERSTVDVRGEPARVHVQGMLLEGSDLHVSQRENRMWAEGPGRMTLPARIKQDTAPTPGNHRLTSNSPIWLSWQGGMDFDGQLVRFLKQVEVRGIYTSKAGERLHLQSIGDQLHATLNRYVAFDRTKETDGIDVTELRFLGDVFTQNQTFNAQDIVTSQDRMKTRDLNLDRRTGKFAALGPGWITTTRVDKGSLGNRRGAPPSGAAAAPQANPQGPQKLVYVRIDYENEIQGNLDLREGEFVHFVRTVYGPVASWDETIEPDRPGGLGPQCMVMTCRRLFVAETGEGAQRAMEMSATGDTVVEGDTFVTKADRLSYAQAKDLLVLEGTGRNFASLQQRSRVGEKQAEFMAQKIMYWVTTGDVKVFGAKQLDYNQIGSPTLPSARLR